MSASKKKSKSSSSRSRPGGGSRPKSQVKLLKEALDLQEATIETLEEQIKERDMSIKSLQMQMEQLQRRLYGPKSDRPGDEAQLLLDDIMGSLQDAEGKQDGEEEAEDDEESDPIKRKKRAKPTGRRMFPDYMERVVEEVDLSDEEKIDPETGCVMAFIGWETRERLVEERARMYVHVLKRAKYAPRGIGSTSEPGVITAPVPAEHGNPIDRCKADVSVLSKIIVSKYCYHLTLYRLQERYWRLGRVWLPRSTMCGWMSGCALALEPLYNAMVRRIIESGYAGLDDTTVKMLDPGAGKTATTRLWVYVGLLKSGSMRTSRSKCRAPGCTRPSTTA
jgi:transposase